MSRKRVINHIVNPVQVGEQSDLFIAQPITFHSMKLARQVVESTIKVNLLTCQYPEDAEIVPLYVDCSSILNEQMLDYSDFTVKRKLPLIREILASLKAVPAEYYIYSNVDISLQPSFYKFVNDRIDEGYDAFVINRRTISKSFSSIDQFENMCSDKGEAHPGFDCFIFKADLLDKFTLGNAGLGANWIGRVIISNLIVHSSKFKIFNDVFQTFHIGDDRSWKNPDFADYDEFNRQELIKILLDMRLSFSGDPVKLAYLNEFLYKDMKWNEDGSNPYMKKEPLLVSTPSFYNRVKKKLLSWFG